MIAKSIATGLVAVAVIGAAAYGATSIAFGGPAAYEVQPVVFGAPQPLDPAPNGAVPTAAQLTTLLNNLADPNVPFSNKSNLIEGGVGGVEASIAEGEMKKAAARGAFPLSFSVANIQPAGPGSASADVTISGPKIATPVTRNATFVNKGGWVLSRASAMQLMQSRN